MNIQHHLDVTTLMAYATGNLSEAFSTAVSTHLSMCQTCRDKLAELEMIGGALLDHVEPVDITAETRENLEKQFDLLMQEDCSSDISPDLIKIEKQTQNIECDILPYPLPQIMKHSYDDIKWKFLAPGIHSYKLPLSAQSQGDLRLLKIAPGYSMPEHGHHGAELTLVLSGSYSDKYGQYCRGDVADLDHDDEHQPIADIGQECICLFASEKTVKFKGLVPKLLQPIIGV